jgi:hypothetical protein
LQPIDPKARNLNKDFSYRDGAANQLSRWTAVDSAGNMGDRRYDLVPGHPDDSILVYRLESTAPKIMMPQIGRAVVHTEGVALLREWVTALQGAVCGLATPR